MANRQIPFTRHEAVWLLEGYLESLTSSQTRRRIVMRVSVDLRKMAINKGLKIDEIYRNVSGIDFQMASMESAYVGKTIRKPASRLFSKIVALFHQNRNEYEQLRAEARAMIEGHQSFKPVISFEPESNPVGMDEEDIEPTPYPKAVSMLSGLGDNALGYGAETEPSIDEQTEPREEFRQEVKVEQKIDNKAFPDIYSDSKRTFADQLSINLDLYSDVPVAELPLPIRALNIFEKYKIRGRKKKYKIKYKITTVSDLLRTTPNTLLSLPGFGAKTLNDVWNCFCKMINNSTLVKEATISETKNYRLLIMQNVESILKGDFSFAENQDLTEETKREIELCREIVDAIGHDNAVALNCYSNPYSTIALSSALKDFISKTERRKQFFRIAEDIPVSRRNKKAAGYIFAFTDYTVEQEMLLSMCKSKDATIKSMVSVALPDQEESEDLLVRFLKWCAFDITAEIEALFLNLYSEERMKTIIQMRSRNKTLEQVGHVLGVTRERVRQIEKKGKRIVNRYQEKIVLKVAAEKNGAAYVTPTDIEEYCPNDSVELLYFLRDTPGNHYYYYTYDTQLDVFILGDTLCTGIASLICDPSLKKRVLSYLETLPDIFKVSQLPELQEDAEVNHNIPRELLARSIAKMFRLRGDVYHRTRLPLSKIYSTILEKYYPEGIHVYDHDELQIFRALVYEEFGDVGLPENDRALTKGISKICVLCGRGMYKPRQKRYISKQLAKRIHQYIEDSEHKIFLMNSLFSVFERDLNAEGITNKYYLQGILHELFSDEYFFRHDYLSKDEYTTSVYSTIVSFIKKSEYPVHKQQIKQAFPGITEIVIALSVSDSEVLNYFGAYLHASRLNISGKEQTMLKTILQDIVSDHTAHHSSDVYDIIEQKLPGLFSRNAAMSYYSAFSVLEYLFQTVFQFSRPYVAELGVDMGHPGERLHELIYSRDEFEISDIKEFCKEYRFQISCLLDYVNSCNDRFLLKNPYTMVSIENAGVTEAVAMEVEDIIAQELITTQPISQITCWNRLPKINILWTEWLIYSILNKWGQKVSVSTSSKRLSIAVPLVAPQGKMDTEAFKDVSPEQVSRPFETDDLDHIDVLIEDLIDFDEDM